MGTSSLPQTFKMEQRKNRGLLHSADISSDFHDSLGLINPSIQKFPGYYLYIRIDLFLDVLRRLPPQVNKLHANQEIGILFIKLVSFHKKAYDNATLNIKITYLIISFAISEIHKQN